MNKLILGLIAGLGLAQAAHAADAPRVLPRHDAAITYRSTGSDPQMPATVTVRYFAAGDRVRIDGGALGYLLLDRVMERVELVMPQPRLVIELPPGGGITDSFILGDIFSFHRTGADRVLGRACTLYDVSAKGGKGRVCLTDDGLLLRGEGRGRDGHAASVEAVAVSMATQPAGLFSPPDNYRIMGVPQ